MDETPGVEEARSIKCSTEAMDRRHGLPSWAPSRATVHLWCSSCTGQAPLRMGRAPSPDSPVAWGESHLCYPGKQELQSMQRRSCPGLTANWRVKGSRAGPRSGGESGMWTGHKHRGMPGCGLLLKVTQLCNRFPITPQQGTADPSTGREFY